MLAYKTRVTYALPLALRRGAHAVVTWTVSPGLHSQNSMHELRTPGQCDNADLNAANNSPASGVGASAQGEAFFGRNRHDL